MVTIIDPAEAQDVTIVPMAALQKPLRHHTFVSHRIDPTGKYIKIWNKIKKQI
jgi:hypothetical protein